MKYLHTICYATIVASALCLNPAIAEDEAIPEFNSVDTDQDGYLSRDEAAQVPQIANIYHGADLDQDGQISSNEYERAKNHLESDS